MEESEETLEEVFRALRKGDIEELKRLLGGRITVNTADDLGETLLIKAAFSGQTEVVRFLLRRGADVNRFGSRLRQTAVIKAARIGHEDILKLLIDNKANVNFEDHQRHTALMKACASGHNTCVEILTRANAIVNTVDGAGLTALMKAAYIGNRGIVSTLIQAGASVNITDANGNTALKIAVRERHVECVNELLNNGADIKTNRDVLIKVMLNWYPGMDRNLDVLDQDLTIVKMLCERGADVNDKDNDGYTLLMRAAKIGFSPCVLFLCQLDSTDVNLPNASGETALMIAAKTERVDIVNACLEKGANANLVDMSGFTAIMHAAVYDQPSCVEALAMHGADTNVVDRYRMTPLMHMAQRGHAQSVRRLIDCGALKDQRNAIGKSALGLARNNSHMDVVRILLMED